MPSAVLRPLRRVRRLLSSHVATDLRRDTEGQREGVRQAGVAASLFRFAGRHRCGLGRSTLRAGAPGVGRSVEAAAAPVRRALRVGKCFRASVGGGPCRRAQRRRLGHVHHRKYADNDHLEEQGVPEGGVGQQGAEVRDGRLEDGREVLKVLAGPKRVSLSARGV